MEENGEIHRPLMSRRRRWMLPSGLRDRHGPRLTTTDRRRGTGFPDRGYRSRHGVAGGQRAVWQVPLVAALAAAALPVVVVNPRQVRDFALGHRYASAKTDSLDAAGLAQFADCMFVPPGVLSVTPRRRYSTRWRHAGIRC